MVEIHTADRASIREVNLRAVIETLRIGAMTRAKIVRKTGLSGPTVSAVVGALTEAGLVSQAGEGPVSGGRRGETIKLNETARTVLSVDLSHNPPRRALIDLNGAIVPGSSEAVITSALRSPQSFVEWAAREANTVSSVVGIGLAVPGITDPFTGTVEWAPQLLWRDAQLLDNLRIAVPKALVVVENDLNLAALGEHKFGRHGAADLVMFGIRGGLGAGIILKGELHRGVHFAAGEIGYLPAPSGLRGSRDFGELEATLFDRLSALGEDAVEAPSEITELLFTACRAVAAVLDVGVIVLGEEVLGRSDILTGELTAMLKEVLPHAPEVTRTRLGANGTLRGAGASVHQQLLSDVRRLLA